MSPRRPLALTGGAVPLPASPSAADQGWRFAGIMRSSATVVIGADGTGTASFPALDTGSRWHISRATISCDSAEDDPEPVMNFYVVTGGHPVSEGVFISGTSCGLVDEADYANPDGMVILPGEQLLAQWTGADQGDSAIATVQYELWTQAS